VGRGLAYANHGLFATLFNYQNPLAASTRSGQAFLRRFDFLIIGRM
jgi:hypothetical protein